MTSVHYEFPDLSYLFSPRSIAIVGASAKEHSIGNHAMKNVLEHSSFDGVVYPVNPKQTEVMGQKCYPDIASLPETVDVVIVVIPAPAVRECIEQAGSMGVGFAIILTSGFSEADDWGRAEEAKLVEISKRTGIRIYGPNCPGLVNLTIPLGMTFSPAFKDDIYPGAIGLATQGGGLGRNMLQHSVRGVGFGNWSSSGNECDLQVADFVHHMAGDPDVKVIGCLIEGFKDGARFVAALARAAECGKPVVGLKVGRSQYGAKAAQSHTASITGSAEVNSTVFKQMGMIEVDDIDELIDVAQLLERKMPIGDEKIAIFASSGGAASLCADNVGMAGLTLAQFSEKTSKKLDEILPAYAGKTNPIDTTSISISHPDDYRGALIAAAADENVALVLAPMPMDYGSYSKINANSMIAAQQGTDVPIVPIWMSERQGDGYAELAKGGLTPFRSLRNMRKAVRRWIDYGVWKSNWDERWTAHILSSTSFVEASSTRTLSEVDAKQDLACFGVPVTKPQLAKNADEAIQIAERMNTPVAMKIVSIDIIHKSDIGGVKLNVRPKEVANTFDEILANAKSAKPKAILDGVLIEPMAKSGGLEAFVGVARDPVFGHIMTFGLGGIYVEMFADVARRMLPVTPEIAREMIDELQSSPLITGYRGESPRDVEALCKFVGKISDYVVANADRIEEMDINPVWVGSEGEGVTALDAVIVVQK